MPRRCGQKRHPRPAKPLATVGLAPGGEGTQTNPLPAPLLADAAAEYTDPRAYTWRYRLDWSGLGTATQLTDLAGVAAAEAAGSRKSNTQAPRQAN